MRPKPKTAALRCADARLTAADRATEIGVRTQPLLLNRTLDDAVELVPHGIERIGHDLSVAQRLL